MKPKVLKPKRHVDPMRYPKVQSGYENGMMKSFNPNRLFADIVKTMVTVLNNKEQK